MPHPSHSGHRKEDGTHVVGVRGGGDGAWIPLSGNSSMGSLELIVATLSYLSLSSFFPQ